MVSPTPCQKSRKAVTFASCHKHPNLSLLSVSKIRLDVLWQFPASLKFHPPPSLTPVLNVYWQTNSPTLPRTSPSCVKAPSPLHEVFQTSWLFLSHFLVIPEIMMVLFSPNYYSRQYLKNKDLLHQNLSLEDQPLDPPIHPLRATRNRLPTQQTSQLSPVCTVPFILNNTWWKLCNTYREGKEEGMYVQKVIRIHC